MVTRTRIRFRDRMAVFWSSRDAEWHKYGLAIVGLLVYPVLGPWLTYYAGLNGWVAGLLAGVPIAFCVWWIGWRQVPKRHR